MTDDADTPELLAAEYVLGTLATNEREQAEALIASDPAFARLVLPQTRGGLLVSRRRLVDVVVLGALAVGLLVAGLVLPAPM